MHQMTGGDARHHKVEMMDGGWVYVVADCYVHNQGVFQNHVHVVTVGKPDDGCGAVGALPDVGAGVVWRDLGSTHRKTSG